MADLTTLHRFLRIELPGCPEPVLSEGVLKATQDFFKRSQSYKITTGSPLADWTEALPFPTVIDLPDAVRIVRVDTLKYTTDGTSMEIVPFNTRQQLDMTIPNWEVEVGTKPKAWTHDEEIGARIIPIAAADVLASLQMRLVVTPDDTATSVPDFLYYEFEEYIKVGALARLMKIPGKDWTDLRAAGAYAALFEDGIRRAKSRGDADFGQPNREMAYGGI
jgi:hypothetical protein